MKLSKAIKCFSTIWIWYGLAIAWLLILLNVLQYHYLSTHLSIELYLSICVCIFTLIGIWIASSFYRSTPELRATFSGNGFNLTDREQVVLSLISEGLSNDEIAEKLSISIHTVKSHVSNIFTKMDVKRRTQAVKKAQLYLAMQSPIPSS
ncbi:MAG: helix-turn-helix transcriptional regulator [Saprospiraceae bacterium]|nr:helix-turn-helix transcriptional regulator [Saprospiraceae bacterium]